jgi:tryprostatin B 6-hydroxylase
MTTWLRNIIFDLMGDLAFSKSFSFTDDLASIKKQHNATTVLGEGFAMLRLFTPIPWITGPCVTLAYMFPFVTSKWNRALTWTSDICDEKLEEAARQSKAGFTAAAEGRNDVFSRFIRSASLDGDSASLDRMSLYGDALTVTVAGSDTTAEVLTMLLYELASQAEVQEQLRKEIAISGFALPGSDEKIVNNPEMLSNLALLQKIPFLDACINEAMRLYPAVPTGSMRQTVDKGFRLGDKWIPPNTVLVTPRWTMGRRK